MPMYFSFPSRCKPTTMLKPVCNSMDLRADLHIEWLNGIFLPFCNQLWHFLKWNERMKIEKSKLPVFSQVKKKKAGLMSASHAEEHQALGCWNGGETNGFTSLPVQKYFLEQRRRQTGFSRGSVFVCFLFVCLVCCRCVGMKRHRRFWSFKLCPAHNFLIGGVMLQPLQNQVWWEFQQRERGAGVSLLRVS